MKSQYKSGDKFQCDFSILTIMAIKDGWYMCRYKNRMPFVKDYNQLEKLLLQQKAVKL